MSLPLCPLCGEHHQPTTIGDDAFRCAPKPTTEAPAPAALLTIIESPYAGAVAANLAYARHCVRHSILLGETPFASHLFYTQPTILDDTVAEEREKGLALGWAFYSFAVRCAVYDDLGISSGMSRGIAHVRSLGIPVVFRRLHNVRPRFPIAVIPPVDKEA